MSNYSKPAGSGYRIRLQSRPAMARSDYDIDFQTAFRTEMSGRRNTKLELIPTRLKEVYQLTFANHTYGLS